MKWWTFALVLTGLWSGFAGASGEVADIHWSGRFEERLSAYNLFADPEAQAPNGGLLPYEVITPLFSDYAEKDRFIYLPPGTAMTYREDGAFVFPAGAALVKTFSYRRGGGEEVRERNLVETRLMIRAEDGWHGAAYVWNDEQTDAALAIAGARVPVTWTDDAGGKRSTEYLVPNMNQCKACHAGYGAVAPLGMKARHVNRSGVTGENQLDCWAALGVLKGMPEAGPAVTSADWTNGDAPLRARVGAYFDINCGHCHNPEGQASHTGLTLAATGASALGVLHRPTAAGNASRGTRYAVVPGDPAGSFLLNRLMSAEPNIRMPEIGRTVVHEEGVALVRAWIASME